MQRSAKIETDNDVDISIRQEDAKVAFELATFFVALFTWAAAFYLGMLPGYLVACADESRVRGIFSSSTLAAAYRVNVACSAAYVLLFIGWWRRTGQTRRSGMARQMYEPDGCGCSGVGLTLMYTDMRIKLGKNGCTSDQVQARCK
jgi:hypothetical protein